MLMKHSSDQNSKKVKFFLTLMITDASTPLLIKGLFNGFREQISTFIVRTKELLLTL